MGLWINDSGATTEDLAEVNRKIDECKAIILAGGQIEYTELHQLLGLDNPQSLLESTMSQLMSLAVARERMLGAL